MSIHRIAVVGCGAIARDFHIPNIMANPRIELALTCDVDSSAAKECARQFKAGRASADWHEVVEDPDIDLILLTTHTNLRGELILPALKAGKPVYVEKPLANSLTEMLEIVGAVRETKVPVCVGHNRRSSPGILDLKRLLKKAVQGEGGWLPSVDRSHAGTREKLPEEQQIQILMRVNDDVRSWKDWIYHDREGILFAEMVHFIDVALWLNPTAPVRVFAEGSARGNFSLLIRFQDGSLTTIQHTLCGHFDYPKELIEISANYVTLTLDHHVELRQRGLIDEPFRITYPFMQQAGEDRLEGIEGFHQAVTRTFEEAQKKGTQPAFITPDKGHAAHLDRFLDCIEGKGENPCDVVAAVVVTRIALKLLESVRLGLPLPIGPEDWHIPDV
ncbi:MAG: Gfo/Idh/MocA family oxidoreductase [Planctomycetota bacterium]|nr:MAG: Gfo/Idh/MocA family oxidoreductase [Planctomycetota bacterium]